MNEFFSKKTLYFVLACCALGGVYGFVSSYARARSPERVRATAIEIGNKACVEKGKEALVAAGRTLPPATLATYCTCAVSQTTNALTDDQLMKIDRAQLHVADALGQPRYTAIIRDCQAQAGIQSGM